MKIKQILLIVILTFLPLLNSNAEDSPNKDLFEPNKESFSFFKNKKFKFIPVPIFEQSPDEGRSYGIMPILIGSNKGENQIKMILGNIFEYNNITNFGYGALAQIFPKEHQKIELFGLLSQHHQKKFRFRFYDIHFADKLYVDFNFIYHRTPFTRFFGIGPNSADFDDSNYTGSIIELDPTIGYYLSEILRIDFTPSFHHRDLSGRAIQSIADTNTKYNHLNSVKNSSNFIPEIGLVLDTRPDKDFSREGFYTKLSYFFSHKNLGSDDQFQGIKTDIRYLFPLIKDKTFTALRFSMEKRYGSNIPFFEQSELGGGFELRSHVPARFIDKGKMIFQIEQRVKLKSMEVLNKKFDLFIDPFLEVGRVYEGFSDLGFNYWQPVGGVGFRLFVPPNVIGRLDLSIGSNGFEIYTGLGYPF